MSIKKNSRVMHMAHALYRHYVASGFVPATGYVPLWSDSVREAWRLMRVRAALTRGVVLLRYYSGLKVNERRGTLCPQYIPSSCAPSGRLSLEIEQGLAKGNWDVMNYYDLEKQGWRSFRLTMLFEASPVTIEVQYSTTGYSGECIYN
ncbi:MAG: hypothetical protein IJT12_09695 [Paludibacteraceae bacterium]|nr:hypothetical protein [Paludibacteraceae bacterium]